MRKPCQVMTTSPGRSASQATPSDSAPTTMRKRTTRIIAGRLAERRERVGGDLPARRNGRLARLRLLDPVGGERFCRVRQCGDIGERRGDVGVRGVDVDPRDDRRRIVARPAHRPA